jgi:hypothetical protein
MTSKLLRKEPLNKFEKLRLFGMIIKAVTGVIGSAVIIENQHPYIALTVLAIGAGANEIVSFLKDREYERHD